MTLILSGSDGLSDVDGTAAAPALRGTDTNTGIFFPAADTIAFAEGGVESMRIDSSGNVGIGTSSPTAGVSFNTNTRILGIAGSAGASALSYGAIALQNNRATATVSDTIGSLGFLSANDTAPLKAEISSVLKGSGGVTGGFGADLVFSTRTDNSASVTERMRIDSSGNLLLGTTATRTFAGVTAALQVESTTVNGGSQFLTVNNATAGNGPLFSFNRSRGTALGAVTAVAQGDTLGRVFFAGADGTALIGAASISAQVDATPGTNDMPGRLIFSTTADGASSPTERMRIDSSGNVGIGTSSPLSSSKLTVSGAVASNGGLSADLVSAISLDFSGGEGRIIAQGSSGNSAAITFRNGNSGSGTTERMRIDTSGNLLVGGTSTYSSIPGVYSTQNYVLGLSTGYWKLAISSTNFFFAYGASGAPSDRASINSSTGVYTPLSDRNKKKDFEASNIGLSAVMQLKPTLFRMIEDDETKEKELGFIAQEVQSVIPQAYFEQNGSDGTKFIGLQDRPIIAVLTKAIQEQQALIQSLTTRITALETK